MVPHSQITATFQPRSSSSRCVRMSRATLASNFRVQNSTFDFGVVAFLQPGCRCQKHPCTKIAMRHRGNTMSGCPGRSFRCSRNLRPIACATFRTRISGPVSLLPTRDMSQDRRSGDNRSAIGLLGCHSLGQVHPFRNKVEESLCHDRRYAIPDHSKAVPNGWMKAEIVGETLKTRRFANRDHSGFFGMNRTHGLERAVIASGSGAESRALAVPAKSGVSADIVLAALRDGGEPIDDLLGVERLPVTGKRQVRRSTPVSICTRRRISIDSPYVESVFLGHFRRCR